MRKTKVLELSKNEKVQLQFSDKKQGENLYYVCCLSETNGPPVDLLVNYTAAAWVRTLLVAHVMADGTFFVSVPKLSLRTRNLPSVVTLTAKKTSAVAT